MQTLTLRIKDINSLNQIQKNLLEHRPLTTDQLNILSNFFNQLPLAETLLSEKMSLNEPFGVKIRELERIQKELGKWKELFGNLPGWNYCPLCYFVENDNSEMLRKNVLMIAHFAPSFTYNSDRNAEPYEVHLKDDGNAYFRLPTLEDAERYPEFYNFSGSWKEAYLRLIETLQKGWPMEEFPEELQKFLPKQ